MKKKVALALALAMCISMLSGCAEKKEINYWDVYKSTFSSEIKTLNPYALSATSDYTFIANLIDGLVETDSYGRYVPCLAESWEKNEDMSVWTFKLRQGQYWVNDKGEKTEYEVTAQNFVDSMRYIADPANGAKNFSTVRDVVAGLADYYWNLVDIDEGTDVGKTREQVVASFDETVGVKALDKYTVEYTLDGPTPYFLTYTLIELLLPVEQKFLEQVGENFGTGKENLLYCGGYYFSDWERDKLLKLTKNPFNWDAEHITLNSLNFEYVADGISNIELFQRGQVASTKLTTEDLNGLRSTEWEQYIYLSEKTLTTYWFEMNHQSRNPEFAAAVQNINFRKAISQAIDAVTLSAIWEPNDPAFFTRYTLLPEGCMFDETGKDYTDYPQLKPFKENPHFDKDKAKESIDKAISEICEADGTIKGAKPGKVDMLPITEFDADGKLPIDIVYPSGSSETEMKKSLLLKEMLENYLGKENVNIVLGYANNSFSDEVWALCNFDLVDDSYSFRYGDPSANLNRITTEGTMNEGSYNVPEYDALVKKAMGIFDTEERYSAFADAEKWMIDNAIIIPYMSGGGSYMMTRIVPYSVPGGKFGMGSYKYKGAKIQDTPVTVEQHKALKEAYDKQIAEFNKG